MQHVSYNVTEFGCMLVELYRNNNSFGSQTETFIPCQSAMRTQTKYNQHNLK